MAGYRIEGGLIEEQNRKGASAHAEDLAHLGRQLERRGIDIERATLRVQRFEVALPTWGVGTGGTRFGRFPGPGEPRNVFEKLEDCAVVQQLVRTTPAVSPHFPWDTV